MGSWPELRVEKVAWVLGGCDKGLLLTTYRVFGHSMLSMHCDAYLFRERALSHPFDNVQVVHFRGYECGHCIAYASPFLANACEHYEHQPCY